MSTLYLELARIVDEEKPLYIHKKYSKLKEFETKVANFHPAVSRNLDKLIKKVDLIKKHFELMKKDEFDWVHEQQVNKLNFDTIKEILTEFLKLDYKTEDKNFIDFPIFRMVLLIRFFRSNAFICISRTQIYPLVTRFTTSLCGSRQFCSIVLKIFI